MCALLIVREIIGSLSSAFKKFARLCNSCVADPNPFVDPRDNERSSKLDKEPTLRNRAMMLLHTSEGSTHMRATLHERGASGALLQLRECNKCTALMLRLCFLPLMNIVHDRFFSRLVVARRVIDALQYTFQRGEFPRHIGR